MMAGLPQPMRPQWWHTLEDTTTYNDGHGDKYRPNYLNSPHHKPQGPYLWYYSVGKSTDENPTDPAAIEGKAMTAPTSFSAAMITGGGCSFRDASPQGTIPLAAAT